MTLAASLPQPFTLRLTPWQQWHNFSEPRDMHEWIRKNYGDMTSMHFQGRDHCMILTPRSAREVFTSDPNGYDAFWKDSFAGMNGEDSLWVLIQERHRRERQLFAPAVHANHFRAYGEVIREIARSKYEQWHPGQVVKGIDTTLAISLDIIMRLVFGVEDEETMQEGRKVIRALTSTAHPLIVFYPKLQRPWFPLWWPYVNAKKNLYHWFDKVMSTRRASGKNVQDVLGVLMQSHWEDGTPYSDEHIHNELLSVLTAGHVTTATALAWALYELGCHPEVMEKLRAELTSTASEFDPGLILKFPYLDAICNEVIRLHPILAECARVPMQPMEILGHHIPAGHALVVSIVSIHHDPELYPEPDEFKPERFLERKYGIYEFLPFGGGHRRCMGAGLAEYSIRIAVAEAALHWDFEPARKDFDIRHDLAMGPKYGVPLRIKSRRNFGTGEKM